MKLCYIANAVSIHTHKEVSYFAHRGHNVHLISDIKSSANNIEHVNLHVLRSFSPQIKFLSFPINLLFHTIQVRKLVRKIEPDILHASYILGYGSLGVFSGFHPIVLSAWGSDILVNPKQNPVYRFLIKYALKKADCIICVSSALAEEAIKLGAAANKIKVTPRGINTQEFSPIFRSEVLLRDLSIGDSPVVISTRSLSPIYDVETLIKAIPTVLQVIPEVKFIIAGEGERRNYFETLARSLGILDSIRFVGQIPNRELPIYLSSSDVYVSTSLSDGTSISLLEALACEVAPIVTDIPANKPWVTDGENGLLFSTGDYETLAAKILLLLKDDDTRTRFGRISRSIVVKRAEYLNEMFKVEEIYGELMRMKS